MNSDNLLDLRVPNFSMVYQDTLPFAFNSGEYEMGNTVINQVGDIKLEWNLEYRFRLGVNLEGALWTDAGNIWLYEDDPDRPFSVIRTKAIFTDSYLTAGLGLE